MPCSATREDILSLLRAWIAQRPGLDPANYGDCASYAAEVRGITLDLHHARDLMRAVENRPGIGADELRAAFRAYSGRLSLDESGDRPRLDYCMGQYWPTEYRRAACAVLASAIWEYESANMPAPVTFRAKSWGRWSRNAFAYDFGPVRSRLDDAQSDLDARGGREWGHVAEYHDTHGRVTAGDWLRDRMRREFHRGITRRWFN